MNTTNQTILFLSSVTGFVENISTRGMILLILGLLAFVGFVALTQWWREVVELIDCDGMRVQTATGRVQKKEFLPEFTPSAIMSLQSVFNSAGLTAPISMLNYAPPEWRLKLSFNRESQLVPVNKEMFESLNEGEYVRIQFRRGRWTGKARVCQNGVSIYT